MQALQITEAYFFVDFHYNQLLNIEEGEKNILALFYFTSLLKP